MGSYHAKLSPSGAYRWSVCTASPTKQEGFPNTSNPAARMGTCCHQMAEEVVRDGVDPQSYLGRKLLFWRHPESESGGECWSEEYVDSMALECVVEHEVEVTEEMVDAVVRATTFVKHMVDTLGDATLLLEQAVSIGQITGEDGATGSCDVSILHGRTARILDYKFGRHKVYASELLPDNTRRPNLQMAMYALGALHDFQMFHDQEIDTVTMIIVQPLVNHVSEFTCSVEDLRKTEEFLRDAARRTREDPVFVPSFDACHFCRAKGHCQAQRAEVFKTALDGFEEEIEPVSLALQWSKVQFIRDWCDAVELKVIEELSNYRPVEDAARGLSYKLIEGRKGDLTWTDPEFVAAELRRMKLKREDIYDLKLKTPTTITKSEALGPTQKKRVLENATRADGKPKIVPSSDPKPNLYPDPFSS